MNTMKQCLSDWLRKTVELTVREKGLLEKILQLTAAQAKLLGSRQAQELLSLINERQKCINDITVINSELLQVEVKILNACGITSWPAGKTVYNSEWQKIESLRQDIQELLWEVQSLDECNRQAISKKSGELKKYILKKTAKHHQYC
jgi:hypothetical protein